MSKLTRKIDGIIKGSADKTPEEQQVEILVSLGFPKDHPLDELGPVMREAVNEPVRRAKMAARIERRKEARRVVKKRGAYGKIIQSKLVPKPGSEADKIRIELGLHAREFLLHATKGWRSYRATT